MTARGPHEAQRGHSLPVFDRIAPAPPPSVVAEQIELHTRPGDVVADLFGRGGWVARAAVERQRRAVSIESGPLTRMLAEVVLRPPDVRHLDAAFHGLSASPRHQSSLKVSIADTFATRCATCGRMLVADEFVWTVDNAADVPVGARPVARHYRCTVCRDQLGGSEQRQGPLDADDLRRAHAEVGAKTMRASLLARFPRVTGAERLPEDLLDLHTGRQLVGLGAILERIEGDLREAPVQAALRLALAHAILPASRLANQSGRISPLRVASGHVRPPTGTQFRERNPWLEFDEAFRMVRGFAQRLGAGSAGSVQARVGADLQSLGEGTASAVLALDGPAGLRALYDDPDASGRMAPSPRIRLVLGQPPVRPNLERVAAAYHATAWVLGREAASLLPNAALAGASHREPWSWQIDALERVLTAVEPSLARDARVVQLVDGGAEAILAAVIGGVSAGYRLVAARLPDPTGETAGIVELKRPGGRLPPGPRTRANVGLEPLPGGAGDPHVVPSARLFSAGEPIDARPFSAAEAARTVTEVAIEILQARGEPASYERLIGEILVGLDRSGQLARLVTEMRTGATAGAIPARTAGAVPAGAAREQGASLDRRPVPPDAVERLQGLIRDELARSTQRRLVEVEPGRWWLADPVDIQGAATPLADRVEWAVFSLLSTAGPIAESAFFERIAAMFAGHDLPDDGLVRVCLESYRSTGSTPDQLVTDDDLFRRSNEHTDLLATIAAAGHRLGMRVWIGRREQTRRFGSGGGVLGDLLDDGERRASLVGLSRATAELAQVDAIWYVRGKLVFLFEVEWTAMFGDPLLRRHARIPPEDAIIRFLVIAPERTELVRFKIERSPLLRAALEAGNWHIVKSDHLRTFLARDPLDLADLEPYLGLDPQIERSGEQMPLFDRV